MARQLATADETFDQIVDFLEHFSDLEDPRQRAKVLYPLDEVLLLCLLGVLAGRESCPSSATPPACRVASC